MIQLTTLLRSVHFPCSALLRSAEVRQNKRSVVEIHILALWSQFVVSLSKFLAPTTMSHSGASEKRPSCSQKLLSKPTSFTIPWSFLASVAFDSTIGVAHSCQIRYRLMQGYRNAFTKSCLTKTPFKIFVSGLRWFCFHHGCDRGLPKGLEARNNVKSAQEKNCHQLVNNSSFLASVAFASTMGLSCAETANCRMICQFR